MRAASFAPERWVQPRWRRFDAKIYAIPDSFSALSIDNTKYSLHPPSHEVKSKREFYDYKN